VIKRGNAEKAGTVERGTDRSISCSQVQTAAVSSLQTADAPAVVAKCDSRQKL
jgi:catabolite regulation protein CreA